MTTPIPEIPVKINVDYSAEKKELRIMPIGLPRCKTLYDKTPRWFRSTEYVFCHFDGKRLHITFLRKGRLAEISS